MNAARIASSGWQWMLIVLAAVLLAGLVPITDGAMASQPTSGEQFPAEVPPTGKVIVVLKPGRSGLAGQVAATANVQPGQVYTAAIQGFSAPVDETSLASLRNNPNVAYISAVYPIQEAAQTPSTGIPRSAIDRNPDADIDGSPTRVDADIAILDGGVQPDHPDLNVVGGRDCTSSNPNAWAPNSSGDDHGTHVAGIAAARDNSYGVVGAAPGARIWSVQVLVSGAGDTSNLICGLDWVVSRGGTIDVVNLSISSVGEYPSSSCGGSDALHNAVCTTYNAGIPMFGAVGNQNANANVRFPGVMDEIMGVGAITDSDGRPGGNGAGLSCGSSSDSDDSFAGYSNYGSRVEIVAPGTGIRSTINNGSYGFKCGTSMASPLVAGIGALYKASNPGASSAATYNWILGENSTAAGSPAGYSGASYRLLYASQESLYTKPPAGTRTPSFNGRKLPIQSSFGSSNGSGSARVWDNNQGSSWYTTNSNPTSGFVQLDLGANQDLTGIKWMFRLPRGADYMRVSVAQQGGSFTQIGVFSNGQQENTFYGTATSKRARYVRFSFENPLNRDTLGYLNEVEIWGGVEYSAGTRTPYYAGKSLNIRSSFGSSNGSGSGRVWDNNQGSSWYTTTSNPSSGFFQLDLGGNRQLSGVKWMFRLPDGADAMQVSVAQDGGSFTSLGTFQNGQDTLTFYGVGTNKTARYVRFSFQNPLNRSTLGYVAEVEVWGGVYHGPGTRNPSFSGGDLPIQSSFGSSNGSDSARVWDNNQGSSWYTTSNYPNSGFFQLDLGQDRDLSGIKWQFRILDAADEFQVSVAMDGGSFVTLGTFSDGYYDNTWYGVATSKTARYVRIRFTNPNGLKTLGYMSEVEIWGGGASSSSFTASAAGDPTFDGEIAEVQRSYGSSNGSGSRRVWDGKKSTSWYTVSRNPKGGRFVVDLGEDRDLTGIRWMYRVIGEADEMTAETRAEDGSWQPIGTFGNGGATSTWYGEETENTARYVRFTFANPNLDRRLGGVSEIEVWAQPVEVESDATPESQATPVADATPEVQATPVPDQDSADEGTEPDEERVSPELEASPAIQATPVVEDIIEEEPSATDTAEIEPTQPAPDVVLATVQGTGGTGLTCRIAPSTDADAFGLIEEGAQVPVLGEAQDGWLPVQCPTGEPGFASTDFLIFDDAPVVVPEETANPENTATIEPEETVPEEPPTATGTTEAEPLPTATETEVATLVPTIEPTPTPTPIPEIAVVSIADSEQSASAVHAVDNDPNTWWLVSPLQTPEEVRLRLDLGAVQPIGSIQYQMATSGTLPTFEIWLSVDGETWWSVRRINGFSLQPGVTYEEVLKLQARFVRFVVPDADQTGLGQIGGISEIRILPSDSASTLDVVGAPVTPTPLPVETVPPLEPTVDQVPQPEQQTDPPAETVPTEEPVQSGEPVEGPVEQEPPSDGPEPGNQSGG